MQENPYCSTTLTHGLKKWKILLLDVIMGNYDGAEACAKLWTLLSKLKPLIGTKYAGLYRDDG